MFQLASLLKSIVNPIKLTNSSINLQQVRDMGYKLKTHKGAAKRFRKTSTGHKRGQAGKQHLNFGMSGERRGRLRGTVEVTSTQSKLLDRMQIR